ncbi:hypothetical protein BDV93DRAFT_516735 [Ceratobasidium sp. AG-I]|nr:hypothetical protein BDV93DRAFT_516735 [Ceratobasidium sp. AG-I]
MPVSAKRKLELANIERALQGKRAEKACEDSESALPVSAHADDTQSYGASDPMNLEQHSANLIARTSDTQSDDSDSSSEGESEVDDEPDEVATPRTPPSSIEVKIALDKINAAIRTRLTGGGYKYANLDRVTAKRYDAMSACIYHYLAPESEGFIDASRRAARGQGKGSGYARSIRRWIRRLIKSGDLPRQIHRWWNVSTLEDEDVAGEIKIHLQRVGKYAHAADIVEFLNDPETRGRLCIVKKKISVRTAQRRLFRVGYRWRSEPKGQYFDGHERDDVVAYRQSVFIPFWQALERRCTIYNEEGIPDPQRPLTLRPGETEVVFWFHDESIFYAHDRRLIRWVFVGEHPTPFKKGEGYSMMIADFTSAQWGWLHGADGTHDCDQYICQGRLEAGERLRWLREAIQFVQKWFPHQTHVFVYDNAPCHTKRPPWSISARHMPKKPSANFTFPSVDLQGRKIQVQMEPGKLSNGVVQPFYYPDNHPKYPGMFKGMAQILRERNLPHIANKLAECPSFKCEEGVTDCCCRRTLFCQPDFAARDSTLEEVARTLGSKIIFLPKYHCELNPIEQCWGLAKQKYQEMPPSSKEADLRSNMLNAVYSVPVLSNRKFAARSQRFIDSYASGSTGAKAIQWATKEYKSHWQTPSHIPINSIGQASANVST